MIGELMIINARTSNVTTTPEIKPAMALIGEKVSQKVGKIKDSGMKLVHFGVTRSR
jgi:hypothetical protein